MITYLINSFLCSSILYVAYILLLENENIHPFKRGYLLFSLIFSLLIPLIPLNITVSQTTEAPKQTTIIFAELNEIQHTVNESIEQKSTALLGNPSNDTPIKIQVIAGVVYLLVTAVLMFRFLLNILSIAKQKRQGIALPYQNAEIILMKEKITPHSFGKYIFINQEDYENKQITEEIIIHESLHIRQRHFLDILFMEWLIIFFWFNPMLYLYRNKIKLNHEFLADKAVIRKNKNVAYYQALLISMACRQKNSLITSSFNFLFTKKRFIMMTKTTSKKQAYCRTLALIPVFVAAIAFFSTKITANALQEQLPELHETADTIIFPNQGVTEEELNEYRELVNKHLKDSVTGWNQMSIPEEEYNRLSVLYTQMTMEQKSKQVMSFNGVLSFLRDNYRLQPPTEEDWNSFIENSTIFFLDGERIEKSQLNDIDRESIQTLPRFFRLT